MTKREQKTLLKGALVGVALGALLPDQYNPVEMFKGMLNKNTRK